MTTAVRHTLIALVSGLLLLSCSGRPKIIPRGVMTDIIAEMLLADQWLSDHPEDRNRADTMLFYDPIFERYGYTFEDYDASVLRYMEDPEKFAKVFRDAGLKLKDKRDVYRRLGEQYAHVKEFNEAIKGYEIRDFDSDTILWKKPITDSLILDSLRRDSLLRDSLAREAFLLDSLRRDSLARDSVARMEHRRDSIIRKLGKRKVTLEKTQILSYYGYIKKADQFLIVLLSN